MNAAKIADVLQSIRKRILVADDNLEFRRSIEKVLLKAGFDVSVAGTGDDASAMLTSNEYALALLDIHMPGKNGLELLQEIREKSLNTKVIMLTVNSCSDMYSQAMSGGAFAYLNKPVKMKKILEFTIQALKQSS